MADFVTKSGFDQLAARVDVIAREVEGEKLITRHILEQSRRNGDDLAAIKTRLDRVEDKLDGVDLKGLAHQVDSLNRKVTDLTRELPNRVGEAIREVLRERDQRS
jgi:tetrahydromethanopterin S-methyltransferase subunit G